MAKKTGACANIDCDHYKESFEIEAGGEFECPYCHQPLREAPGGHNGPGGGKGGDGWLPSSCWAAEATASIPT